MGTQISEADKDDEVEPESRRTNQWHHRSQYSDVTIEDPDSVIGVLPKPEKKKKKRKIPRKLKPKEVFDYKEDILVTACRGTLYFWSTVDDCKKGDTSLLKVNLHEKPITSMVRLSEELVATSSVDGTIRVYNLIEMKEKLKIEEEHPMKLENVGSTFFASGNRRGFVSIWDLETGKKTMSIKPPSGRGVLDTGYFQNTIYDLSLFSRGRLVSVAKSGAISFHDWRSGTLSSVLWERGTRAIRSLDERDLAVGGMNSVMIWNAINCTYVKNMTSFACGSQKCFSHLCLLNRLNLLAGSVGSNCVAEVYSVVDGRSLGLVNLKEWNCNSLCKISGGRFAIARLNENRDHVVSLFDVDTTGTPQELTNMTMQHHSMVRQMMHLGNEDFCYLSYEREIAEEFECRKRILIDSFIENEEEKKRARFFAINTVYEKLEVPISFMCL